MALFGNNGAVSIVFRTLGSVAPHPAVELVLHDALACGADRLDSLDLRFDTRDGFLHVAPGVVARLKGLDFDREIIEQKAFDEFGDARDLPDIKRKRLPQRGACTIRIELSPASIRVDNRVEMPQERLAFLSLKGLNVAAFAPLLIEEGLPRLLFKALGLRMDEIGETKDLALDDEEAKDVLLAEGRFGLETDAGRATT
ncbi:MULTISPECIES: hypothetical protein [unclassified Bradyrhizobium]